MKDVLTSRDLVLVGLAHSILVEAGIPCIVRNEATHNAVGTTIFGQIQLFDPTLSVLHDADWETAMELVKDVLGPVDPAGKLDEGLCPACQNMVPPAFAECWSCGTPIPDISPSPAA